MDKYCKNLRFSSPLTKQSYLSNSNDTIDSQLLLNKLNVILLTFQTQKQSYEEKINQDNKLLKDKINQLNEKIKQLEIKNQKLEHQNRHIKFNYQQKGSLVDYLKNKIIKVQHKFNSEKQQMLSIIKYLQSKNTELNQSNFYLKQNQCNMNRIINNLQLKLFNLSKLSKFNYDSSIFNELKQNHKHLHKVKASQFISDSKSNLHQTDSSYKTDKDQIKNDQYFTPLQLNKKKLLLEEIKHKISSSHLPFSSSSNINLDLDEYHIDQMTQSTIKQKKIKYQRYQNTLNRSRSFELDFTDVEHFDEYDKFKRQENDQKIRMSFQSKNKLNKKNIDKKISINNYGNLIFSDYSSKINPLRLKKCDKHIKRSKGNLKASNICDGLYIKRYL